MTNVLISAAGLCGATIIGAILGFFVKELPHKWNDAVSMKAHIEESFTA